MPGLYGCCMHTGLAHHVLYGVIALTYVVIGKVNPCDEWLPHTVSGNANNGIKRWNFVPCGSPNCSSHWIGRSMSGLNPCCCHWGGIQFMSWHWVVCVLIVFELTNDARTCKIREGNDLWHDVRIHTYRQTWVMFNTSMWGLLRLSWIIPNGAHFLLEEF